MPECYNPYQFLPVTGQVNGEATPTTPWAAVAAGSAGPARHDRWLADAWSGRLLVRLTTQTPTFVGNRQTPDANGATTAGHYRRNGQPAFPGSSLRGMLGALAEALSQSALRVLDDQYLSIRKRAEKALESVGLLVRDGDQWQVQVDATRLPIGDGVLERFSRLWVDRVRRGAVDPRSVPPAVSPLLPDRRYWQAPDTWRPPVGTRVFYRAENDVVAEIAFSKIWRAEVPGTTHDFFRAIGPDLLPWGAPERAALTPAEALFGVAEDLPAAQQGQHAARNLASRIRVYDALPLTTPVRREPWATLRTLNGPKPPSPALYFHDPKARRRPIAKRALNPGEHRPNGRKVYLHHPDALDKRNTWQRHAADGRDHLRLRCRPLARGQAFLFHIDFDNLSPAELGLLWHAIAPATGHLHRLGLGKPLGLGSVALRLEGLFRMHRAQRYSLAALGEGQRWHQAWLTAPGCGEAWPATRYQAEREAAGPAAGGLAQLREQLANAGSGALIDQASAAALAAVGDPARLTADTLVHYPLRAAQHPASGASAAEMEQNGYEWFVENDREITNHGGQALPPLPSDPDPLEALQTN